MTTEVRSDHGIPALAGGESLAVTDNRTAIHHEIPIEDGAIRATALSQIKAGQDEPGLPTYDPAFMATAAVKSAITCIDGDAGILRYRGYPIAQRV